MERCAGPCCRRARDGRRGRGKTREREDAGEGRRGRGKTREREAEDRAGPGQPSASESARN
ncbi:hypothetical protein E3T26_11795 [Cryobacterium sp. TMT1-21]|uniref:Uncharacterized protein n=1 Tax=Cryobacterium shii TaxID=1259235 RepID=A0AAQ2C7H9_9MICO|nr:hypothetical protein E3O49_05090 [Cryobacterium shii]TFC82485.1 hypothetical protein E3T24_13190 [Cryobacterium sp. TmT2-59]TFD12169.1 hypothetical protein E3T26_11795 [Cryobacterium sp. TMT1-21]TFD19678.1 hypothetical protein E3T42_03800 [Cryobacterium sp. TMT4-10]TFD20631.1 hypothetical protein E3T32_08580 [Cryobacterium sp. TMT2-23]